MNINSKTPRIELLLQPREVLNLNNKQNRMAIECKNGMVWVTAGEGDHILSAGSRYIPQTKGSIVIESIGASCLNIKENN